MFARVNSGAVLGVDGYIVQVETDLEYKLPAFATVGLAEGAVRESKERVTSAIKNSGFSFPQKRVTINLAPADVRKEGSAFDLPMAVGILAADGVISAPVLERFVIIGELSLDGGLRPVPGVLSIAIAARDAGFEGIIVPERNAGEAGFVTGIDVYPARSLAQVAGFLSGGNTMDVHPPVDMDSVAGPLSSVLDFSDVKGQDHVKRALEVAASGSHNVLLIGPPGSGKTMLAQRLPGILPSLTMGEALETTKIHSVAGILPDDKPIVVDRPFRNPHYTITDIALIGGGAYPRPGEVSLAHNGVLFIDELPELGKKSIECLRQPLEDGFVTVSRLQYTVRYPASFMFVVAMNPCPCGYLTDPHHPCTCRPHQVQNYLSRISGPILDRVDIHVEVPPVAWKDLVRDNLPSENSAAVRERVNRARTVQKLRFRDVRGVHANAHLSPRGIEAHCRLGDEAGNILKRAVDAFGFSARVYHRILKVARTIADLDGDDCIRACHVSEAVQYRTFDRSFQLR